MSVVALHNKTMRATKEKVNQYNFLHTLHKAKPSTRHHIIHYLSDKGLHCVGEFVHNTLFRRCNLTPKQKKLLIKKLGPQKKAYQKIAKKRTPNEVRRKLIQEQSGTGLLTALLSVGLPLLTSFLFPSKKAAAA